MNMRSIVHATVFASLAVATATLVAADSDYKSVTVGTTETQVLTKALADDASYDKDEDKRICFTTIESLKTKTDSDDGDITYKYVVKGCAVSTGKSGAGQCVGDNAKCTVVTYKVKLEAKAATPTAFVVDDIDSKDGSVATADDDDDDDDDDDHTTTASNSTSSSTATTTSNSTSSSTATSTSTPTKTTTNSTTTNTTTTTPTPTPTSAATAVVTTAASMLLAVGLTLTQ